MTAGIAASGARVAWYYVPETTYGVTPTSAPAFKPIRFTSNGLTEQAN
jgi:hypothetical protein